MTEVTEKKEPTETAEVVTEKTTTEKTKKEADKATSEHKTKHPHHEKPVAQKSGGSAIAVIALLIAAGAVAAGYASWQRLNQKQAELESRLSSEEQTLSSLQNSSQSAQESTLSLKQQIATLTEGVNGVKQYGARLEENMSQINQRLDERRSNEWLVAEARHLINIANHQAQLNHNTQVALTALELADQRLRDADDPSLLQVRQALTDDITSLRSVGSVDTPGIALLLSKLEQEVKTLPLVQPEREEGAAPTEGEAPEEQSGFKRLILKVWSDIKGLVTIRHNTGPEGSPLTTPDQRLYLQQNLRLKLEVARLALLQRDTQTFRDSLATVRQWLESYYDTKASATAAMLTTLTPYATLELQPELPDISHSLHMLDKWLELRKNRTKVEAPLNGSLNGQPNGARSAS